MLKKLEFFKSFQQKHKNDLICKTISSPSQMSDSRVSSVIQEWGSSYPGQAHGQVLGPSNQVAPVAPMSPLDMMSYGPCQGIVRGVAEDREQMMGLQYLSYNTSSSGGQNLHQTTTQQVRPRTRPRTRASSTSCLTQRLPSRTSPPSCCRPSGPPWPRGPSARTAPSTV